MTEQQRDENSAQEPVVVRDKRRIDPDTGAVRAAGAADGDTPAAAAAVEAEVVEADEVIIEQPAEQAADPAAEVKAQLDERTADLQRLQAEYANYRKRVERDRESVAASAKAQVVTEFLGVLDDLERAGAHGDLTGAFKAVADKFTAVLTKTGLEAFGHEGEPFDPAVHEAVQHSTSSEVDGPTVTGVLRRGYRLGDKVVRAALVAVTDHEPAAG
ncbi:nucleotide exchange factor GrpE [Actinokineospora bangkokensis]|uniref:Protein GrpE n=1 Tax=Actinokineospora bangkokensis TaxID=1193682 RepID=A0A1Q9LFX7_9PSEU|nr:nucleotide exchange factor GrpE [Actinokineospora bangkokensis]OLR90947.1 nucleotide exchange factor GrpE [Actinokineospora bangkokensis]